MSTPDFPGIFPRENGFGGPRPTTELHPVRYLITVRPKKTHQETASLSRRNHDFRPCSQSRRHRVLALRCGALG
jgi:hypothetical protein